MKKEERVKELVESLNKAAKTYYADKHEIMSNFEYDALYDELELLEKETGLILENSPTQKVGFEENSKLPKQNLEYPAKSLDKTKDVDALVNQFMVRKQDTVLMWKMDGGTLVATYDNGKLSSLVTRGNGEVGSVVTHNAPFIKGLPMEVPYKGHLVIRGEVVMSYDEFNRINDTIMLEDNKYENPRNLANSTIKLTDASVVKERELWFVAFTLVHTDTMLEPATFCRRLLFMQQQGINCVEAEYCEGEEELRQAINNFTERAKEYKFPVDGLVVAFNDVAYAESLPSGNKYPNHLVGMALKWEDTEVETVLREVEWSASRTGLLNPVAIFDPVRLEGTTVTRASLHNVSYLLDKNLKVGDRITIFKANMIIPQCATNLSINEHEQITENDLLQICPVCGGITTVVESKVAGSITKTMICKNPDCAAKHVGKFVHFAERDCCNIDGLSSAKLERFVGLGWLKELGDIYTLCEKHGEAIKCMEGFGEKSLQNLDTAIEASRKTSFVPFIHSLAIPNIGNGQAKLLNKEYSGDVMAFFSDAMNRHDFQHIEGIGEVLENSIWQWANEYLRWIDFPEEEDIPVFCINREIERLMKHMSFAVAVSNTGNLLAGKTFVITGSLEYYANRDELVKVIEENGGKASGSVSAKTSFLINNDLLSTSGKNKKAHDLNIPIISEQSFRKMISKNVI